MSINTSHVFSCSRLSPVISFYFTCLLRKIKVTKILGNKTQIVIILKSDQTANLLSSKYWKAFIVHCQAKRKRASLVPCSVFQWFLTFFLLLSTTLVFVWLIQILQWWQLNKVQFLFRVSSSSAGISNYVVTATLLIRYQSSRTNNIKHFFFLHTYKCTTGHNLKHTYTYIPWPILLAINESGK